MRRGELLPRLVALFLLVSLLTAPAWAVKTERWELKRPADYLAGKLENLRLSSDGELALGCPSQQAGELAKEIWCSAPGPNGVTYFGAGSPADVIAVGADGKVETVLPTEKAAVTALAVDDRGTLFVGTLGDGQIYKLTAAQKDAKRAEFCRVPSPYIWALVVDPQGNLFAATGPDGKIYRIDPAGKVEEWYDTDELNILCLAWEPGGALLAGGSDRGLLYRITGKQTGTVLHQFAEDEVHALAVRGAELYIGVNKQKARRPREPQRPLRANAAEFEQLADQLRGQYGARDSGEEHAVRPTPAAARVGNLLAGAVYHRDASGRVEPLAAWDKESVLDVAIDRDGAVLVAMAGKARVYRVRDRQQWDLLFAFPEAQATTLALRDGRLVAVGTGNIGSVYRVDSAPAKAGTFTSDVFDARFATQWGSLSWLGQGAVAVTTRAGNTSRPDATWSAWSAPVAASPGRVASPAGRFLQVRAQLTAGDQPEPVLHNLTVHYQVQNQKPEVAAVTVDGAGDSPAARPPAKPAADKLAAGGGGGDDKEESRDTLEPGGPAPKRSVRKTPSPARRVTWQASDKDGDTLVYRLFYRVDGDPAWIPVRLDKPLKTISYTWDTDSVPDGWYRVKVVASDEESNPASEALTGELVSDLVQVDNRRPEVAELAYDAKTGNLSGVARDNLSLIVGLEYAVDGGEWRMITPTNGLLDERTEPFAVPIGPLPAGPHSVAVRATDEEGNVGVAAVQVK